jgi:integrase/recombinase XerD
LALGRQAKIVTNGEFKRLLDHVSRNRNPERDRVMVLLSFKAGLRAKEIARVTWAMVTTAAGELGDVIALTNNASKGENGGREIPMHPLLSQALTELRSTVPDKVRPDWTVIYSERGRSMSPETVRLWFFDQYQRLGMKGASSHSGRRTFLTAAARKVGEVGGSLRDVQALAGHKHLEATQRYIEENRNAKRKLIGLI